MKLKVVLAEKYQAVNFKLRRALLGVQRARRTRFYCVGAPKTGTHSIAAMFGKCARSKHEMEVHDHIDKLVARHEQRITQQQFIEWLRQRDERLSMEVDSAHLHYHMLDDLVREFPDARFLLTIRDCYSWLESNFNHRLRYPDIGGNWHELARLPLSQQRFDHAAGDQVLKEKGLDSLESFLFKWKRRNEDAIAKIPAERLLIVRTDQIARRAAEITAFAGLPPHSYRLERSHEFKNPVKHHLIRQIDRAFLERKVEEYCQPLMGRFFPEIKSLDDAKL